MLFGEQFMKKFLLLIAIALFTSSLSINTFAATQANSKKQTQSSAATGNHKKSKAVKRCQSVKKCYKNKKGNKVCKHKKVCKKPVKKTTKK